MKISYNWLKNYVQTDLDIERIARILTDTGLEVEGTEKIEAIKGGLEGVVIGEVLTCEKHPDADKLNVTTVSIANEILQIVCGAPNVAAGQKVVVATVGCTLYPKPDEPFKIKAAKIRGVESFGMLCAEDELGMGQSHAGIMVLDEKAVVGSPAAAYFDLEDDYEIEIGLTPNRSDAMGHIGVARDIIAYLNFHENQKLTLKMPAVETLEKETDFPINIAIEDQANCPRYCGVTIAGVKVGPSPEWLQKRLRAVGLAPINNVVDVTNFVMRELGTPLHAFDADCLNGKIVVKQAIEGAKFTTLDATERQLKGHELMISNGEKDLCIAGVFGGLDSGISDKTTNVFLESAVFNAISVRKTARAHGLNTDASFRFERGVDPELTLFALRRAAHLIKEIAGGQFGMDEMDVYSQKIEPISIEIDTKRINQLIGSQISNEEIKAILHDLDFKLLNEKGDVLKLEIPLYRTDVQREADIAEEVLRIYGFNKVEIPTKWNLSLPIEEGINPEKVLVSCAEFLVGKGFQEALNNSLTKAQYVEKHGGETLKREHAVEMLNPLSQDLNVMRQSMLFGLLENVVHNQNRQAPNLRLFEFGKVYNHFSSGYNEQQQLAMVITGSKNQESWNNDKSEVNFYTLKGHLLSVFERFGLTGQLQEKSTDSHLFEFSQKWELFKKNVAEIGVVSSKIQKDFGIKSKVYFAVIHWDNLLEVLKNVRIKFKELPKTFAIRRDFAFVLDENTDYLALEKAARGAEKKLLQSVNLFDVYEGDKIAEGKKSYALSFILQDGDRTLTDAEIEASMERIRLAIEKETGATLRS